MKGPGKKRIDVLLAERGLAPSRERAQSLILSGNVLVDDVPVTKAGHQISVTATIRIRGEDHPYVSRGGIKLAGALDAFAVSAEGRRALDVGASTGGFTQVLLLRGAREVVAVDVGHGQMDWKVRTDPRVRSFEGINARALTPEQIGLGTHDRFDLIVVDVSFISLEKVLPALIPFLGPESDLIALVKPQFEAGREEVGKGGLVSSPETHQAVIVAVTAAAERLGLDRLGLIDSPITGTQGNKEFLAHWKRRQSDDSFPR